MISQLRSMLYQSKKPIELPVPVVSIGNISMGGTGKTPLAMLLAERLVAQGIRVALLSRGYGRKSAKPVLLGSEDPGLSAEEIGDEPAMMKDRLPSLAICVHADRARIASENWNRLGNPQLVLLDDGFQHWKIKRDLDVVLWNAQDSLDSKAIPFGKLRESFACLNRADFLIVTGSCKKNQRNAIEERVSSLKPQKLTPLVWQKKSRNQPPKLGYASTSFLGFYDFKTRKKVVLSLERELLLVSGIANPERFHHLIDSLGFKKVSTLVFPDHHFLSPSEENKISKLLEANRESTLLVTEKDYSKWNGFLSRFPGLYARVELKFDDEKFFSSLVNSVVQLCSI